MKRRQNWIRPREGARGGIEIPHLEYSALQGEVQSGIVWKLDVRENWPFKLWIGKH